MSAQGSANCHLPIALFDSGIGGLTVFQKLVSLLPNEKFVYFADTQNFPLGNQSPEKIRKVTIKAALFLQSLPVKMLVLACHTASSHALDLLKQSLSIPVVGMTEGVILSLKEIPLNSRLALLATAATIHHGYLQSTMIKHYPKIDILPLSCPLFASAIEYGILPSFDPIKNQKVDAALLGCTHFPVISSEIEKVLGCLVIDPSHEVSSYVKNILECQMLLSHEESPVHQFYITDHLVRFQKFAMKFLKKELFQSIFWDENIHSRIERNKFL